MKNKLALFIAAALIAPSAFAAEITPYVGLGLVVDKAGTTAKRVKFDQTKAMNPATLGQAFTANAGDDMDFDMAYAGEITAGIKYGNVRGELEVAIRSASEDDYEIFNGTLATVNTPFGQMSVPGEIETSTSVQHNSYMANLYYDFAIADSNWTPYIGAGVGFGTYKQKATIEIDLPDNMEGPASQMGIPVGEMTVADDTLTEFEWQVGLGATYSFTEDWALDIGYKFNSSTVADEFVYAHELKIGARYLF